VAEGTPYGATLADAISSALVLEAMEESVSSGAWVTLG
jgi:hypothetical protein